VGHDPAARGGSWNAGSGSAGPPQLDQREAAAKALLREFVRWRDWDGITTLMMAPLSGAGYLRPTEEIEKAVTATHLVFARVILELVEAAAARAGDEAWLIAALTAVLT
jgi:hypothetical protein